MTDDVEVVIHDRYWVLHEQTLVRALVRCELGEITVAEAIAGLEEHADTDEP